MDAYSGAGKTAEAVAWLEESAPDNPQLYSTLGRVLRARATLGRCGGRLRTGAEGVAAQLRHPRQPRIDADEHQQPVRRAARARRAARGACHPRHRRACAHVAVAGRAPVRRPGGRRSDRAKSDRAEQQERARLLRAGRGARGSAPLPGRRRRAGAGSGLVPRHGRRGVRPRHAAAAPRASPIRNSDSSTRRSPRSRMRASSRRTIRR